MPTLQELKAEYDRAIQKSTMLAKTVKSTGTMGYGYDEPNIQRGVEFSTKDLNQGLDEEVENRRSRNQGFGETLGIFGARLAGKAVTKTAEGAGFIAGLVGIDNNRKAYKDDNAGMGESLAAWIAGASDNGLALVASDLEKKLEDVTPLYNSLEDRADNKANFFNNLFDGDFWAGDAADAGAFLISAWLTGAATAELKVGENAVQLLGKGLKAAGKAVPKGIKAAKIAAATNQTVATAFNTASEAMFEAKDVKDKVRSQKALEMYNLPFEYLNPEQQLEINKIAGSAAAKTFALNAVALAGPNFMQMGTLMKKAGRNNISPTGLTSKGLDTVEAAANSKIGAFGMSVDTAKIPFLGAGVRKFGNFAKSRTGSNIISAAKGIVREGMEENVQLGISNMFENDPTSSLFDMGTYRGIARNVGDNFSSDEGKKSMLLGSIIGSVSNTISGDIDYKRNKKNQAEAKVASLLANTNLYKANNLFEMEDYTENDAEGKPVTKSRFKLDETGNPIIDKAKVQALAMSKDKLEYLDDIATLAEENGDDVLANLARNHAMADWVKAHYNTGTEDLVQEKIAYLENLPDKDYAEQGLNPAEKNKFIVNLKEKAAEYRKLASDIDANIITKDTSKQGSEDFIKRKSELYNIGTTLSDVRSEKNRLSMEKAQLEATPESAALNAKRLAYIDLKLSELDEVNTKFTEEFKKLSDINTGQAYYKDGFKKSMTKKTDTFNPEKTTLEEFNNYEISKMFGKKLELKGQNIENEFFEKGVADKLANGEQLSDILDDLLEDDVAVTPSTKAMLQEKADADLAAVNAIEQTISELFNDEDLTSTDPNVIEQAKELIRQGIHGEFVEDEKNRLQPVFTKLNNLKTQDNVVVTNKTIKERLIASFTNIVKGNLFNFKSSEEYDNIKELEKQQKSLENMIKVLGEKEDEDYKDTIAEYKVLLEETKAAIVIVKERIADKALQQERIVNNEVTLNITQFGLSEDGSVLSKDIYDFYKSILGEELDKILSSIKDLTAWGKMGYLTNMLIKVKETLSEPQIKQLEAIKNTLAKKVISLVETSESGSSKKRIKKYYAANPKYLFKEVLSFLTMSSSLDVKFGNDYSIANLKNALSAGDIKLSVSADVLNEIISLHEQILGIQNTLDFLASEQNIVSEVVGENAIAIKEGTITPSNQQLLALRDLIRFIFTKKPNTGYSNLAYLKGYAGTGKTNIVLKWFTKMSGIAPSEIFATGHNEHSSEAINNSIETNKTRSIEELIEGLKTDLPGIKLVIIDEINALPTKKIKEVIDLINEYNTKNKTDIKIIGLGDPNQITVSQNSVYTPLDSVSDINSELTLITPLTIRYRSNVQSVVDAQDIFLGKTDDVTQDGIYLSTNEDRTLGADGGLSTTGIEEALKQRDLNDGKTRAIIVHPNDVAAWEARNLGVEVVSYIDVQGRTIDEVFVSIDKGKFSDNFLYNKAMYTATSRATNFIYMQGIKAAVSTDATVNKNSDKNATDLKNAKAEFIKNRKEEIAQLESGIVLPDQKEKEPPVEPEVEDEESEEEELDEEPDPEEEEVEVGGIDFIPDANFITLQFPNNDTLKGKRGVAPATAGEKVYYIPIKNSQGFASIGIYIKRPQGYLQVGVLSQEELNNPPVNKKDIFDKLKEAVAPNMQVTEFSYNFNTGYYEILGNSIELVLAEGTLKHASPIKYKYFKAAEFFKEFSIKNLVAKFNKEFFNNAPGKKFNPKNFKIRILTDAEVAAYKSDYNLKAGIPYLVIENPVQGDSNTAKAQFIQLERRFLNKDVHGIFMNPIYSYLDKYNALKSSLNVSVENLAEIINSSEEYLPTLLKKIKDKTGKKIKLTNKQKTLIREIDLLLHEPLTEKQLTVMKKKKVKNIKDPVIVDGKEIKGTVISVKDGKAKVRFGNEEIEVPVEDLKVIANRAPGPAQAAFDEIAKSNRTANGFVIRVKVRSKSQRLTRGKSLLPKTEFANVLNPTSMSSEELDTIFSTNAEGNVSDLRVPIIKDGTFGEVKFNYTDSYTPSNKTDGMLFLDKLDSITRSTATVTIDTVSNEKPIIREEEEQNDQDDDDYEDSPEPILALSKDVKKELGQKKVTRDILKYLQSIDRTLTAEEVKFVTAAELLILSEGKENWGIFKNGIIYLLEDDFGKSYENVARHELFHRIFNMMLTPEQQELVRQKAIKEYGLPANSTPIEVEEAIAEHYQEWRNGKKQASFFNILFNRLRRFLGMSVDLFKDMDSFFANIEGKMFTEIVGFDDVARSYNEVKKDFGTAVNFRNSQLYIVTKLNFLQSKNDNLLSKDAETGKTGVEEGRVPRSSAEMFKSIYNFIAKDYEKLLKKIKELPKGQTLSEEEKIKLEYLTKIQDPVIFKKLIKDMFENTELDDLKETTDSSEILGSDWTDTIDDAEQTNHETKLSSKVKQFLSTIIITKDGKQQQVKPRFAYLAALEALFNIDGRNKENLLKEIKKRFENLSYNSNDVDGVATAINKLVNYAYTEGFFSGVEIPKDYSFLNEDTFKGKDGKFLVRGKLSTKDFFRTIAAKTTLTTEEITALYIINDAETTFVELSTQIASLYKQNVYYGEYNGSNADQQQSFKNAVLEAQVSNYNNNIRDFFIMAMGKVMGKEVMPAWVESKIKQLKKYQKIPSNNFIVSAEIVKEIYTELLGQDINLKINFKFDKFIKDIEDLLAYHKDHSSDEAFDVILLENNKGTFNRLSKSLVNLEDKARPSSYRRADGKIAYLFTLASSAINTLQHFTDGTMKPSFLNSKFYENNSFVNGTNKIYRYINFDAVKSGFADRSVRYKSETEVDWFARNFKYFFLAVNTENLDTSKYIQQFMTISNKPNIIGAEIDFLEWNKIEETILNILKQQNSRNFTNINVKTDLNVFEPLLKRAPSITDVEYTKRIIATIKAKGENLTKVLNFETKTDLSRLERATKKYFPKSENPNQDLAALYFANFYVNSHQLNQLVAGDQAFYQDSFDVIKRMSIAFATGYKGLVSKFGLPEFYKTLVVNDMSSVLGDDFVKFKEVWGKTVKFTDGQGFMTPKRAADLRKGFGNAFKIGNVIKGVHFEIDADGIPRAIKYSCIELTDELCEMFPKLKQVRQALEDNGIDEMVFKSGVKVGAPAGTMTANDNGSIGKLKNGKYVIDKTSVLTLQNNNYRIQENPEKSVIDKEIAFPTQLGYFFNFSGKNFDAAQRLFKAQEELMNLGGRKLLDELGIKNRVEEATRKLDQRTQRENLRKKSSTKLDGNKDLRQEEAINNPKLGINTPFLVKKIITDLSSMFSKATVAIRLPGAGLVLQSAYGTAQFTDKDGKTVKRDLKWRATEGDAKGFAEVILPDFWKNKFKEGDTIMFDTMVGFRIPSTELHSALPLRVVGFYPGNKNVIIAPREIVFFHGSDYDVDKLYVMRKDMHSSNKSVMTLNNKVLYKNGTLTPSTPEFLDDVNKEFTKTLIEIDKAKKAQESLKVRELNKHLDELTELKISHYKNVIVQGFLEVITAEANQDIMMSPITMDRFNGMGIENEESSFDLVARLNGFKMDKPKRKDYDTLKKYQDAVDEYIEKRNAIIFPTRDLYNIEDQMLMHKDNFSGTVLTGVFANMAKVIAYFFQSVNDGSKYPMLDKKDFITLNKYTYKGFEYFEQTKAIDVNYDKDGNIIKSEPTITETIDSLINAAIDTVKEQILPIIGITNNTGGIAVSMIAMGIPVNDVIRVLKQPIVAEINKTSSYSLGRLAAYNLIKTKLEELNGKPLTEEQLAQIEEETDDVEEVVETAETDKVSETDIPAKPKVKKIKIADITNANLEAMAVKDLDKMTKEELLFQYAIIKKVLNRASNISDCIDTASDAYSVLSKFPIEFAKMQDVLDSFDSLWDSKEGVRGGRMVFNNVDPTMLPHINKAFKLLQTLKSNVENLFFVNSKPMQEFAKRLSISTVANENPENKDLEVNDFAYQKGGANEANNNIRTNVIHYLMTGLSYITPEGYAMTNSTLEEPMHTDKKGKERVGVDAFNARFKDKILKLKADNPENVFLKNISFDKRGKLVFNAARNIDQADILEYQMAFDKLKEEVDGKMQYTELQYEFVKYAIINQGLSFGVSNYSLILPAELYEPVMEAFNAYFEDLTGDPKKFEELLTQIESNFKIQYALNTGEKTVNYVTKGQYTEKDNMLIIKNEKRSQGKLFLRKGSALHVLISKPFDTELTYIYVGNINNSPFYQFDAKVLEGDYSILKAFDNKYPIIKVSNNNSDTFTYKSKMVVGTKIRLVNYSDPTRLQMKDATVETVVFDKTKGKYVYTIKNATFVSSIVTDLDIMNSEEFGALLKAGVSPEEALHKIKNKC
jgi:hypothetical protein